MWGWGYSFSMWQMLQMWHLWPRHIFLALLLAFSHANQIVSPPLSPRPSLSPPLRGFKGDLGGLTFVSFVSFVT